MHDDDQLLKALARLSAEEEEMSRLNGRWDALSRGELDREGEAELRALAGESEEMRAAWEAFRPVEPELRQRITKRLLTLVRRREARRWWSLAVAAGLAAVLVGGFLAQAFRHGGREALPTYSLESRGGRATERSSPGGGEIPRLSGDLKLVLTLVPDTAVSGEVALAAFLEQGGTLRPWPGASQRSRIAPSGAVRIEVRARDLTLEAGPARLWLAVARPRELPAMEDLRRRIATGGDGPARWLSQEVLLEAGGAPAPVDDPPSPPPSPSP